MCQIENEGYDRLCYFHVFLMKTLTTLHLQAQNTENTQGLSF